MAHTMLQRIKASVRSTVGHAIDTTVVVAFGTGAAGAVVLGKALAAVALGAFAFAAFLRLTSRRRLAMPLEQRPPNWLSPVVALASSIECAALVEAVDLPVRFSQPGFQYYHWGFVTAFILIAYVAQYRLARALLSTHPHSAAP
jgi:hypothetical protein